MAASAYALDFEADSSQSADTANASNLSGDNQKAIHLWAKTESITGTHVLAVCGTGGADDAWELWFNSSGDLKFYLKQDSSNYVLIEKTGIITTGSWQHIVVGIDLDDSNNNIIYIDNSESHTTTTTGNPTAAKQATGSVYVAQYGSDNLYYDGVIDELAIFNQIPSADDISTWYNNGDGAQISVNHAGLQALWRFDDGSGTSAADSKNSYNLTLRNTPSWVTGKVPIPVSAFMKPYTKYW